MAGRPEKPAYQYTAEGKFVKKWNNHSEMRKHYFSDEVGKRPFYYNNRTGKYDGSYSCLPDGTYISHYRIGRDKLMEQVKIDKCTFCRHNSKEKALEVFNLIGEKMAEFSSVKVAHLMTGIDETTLLHRCQHEFKHNSDNLIYKYKK